MKIKVYVRTTEPWSDTLLKYLNAKHLTYSKVEVSVDKEGYREMMEKSGQKRVPVTDIDGYIIVGFKKKELDAALGLKQRDLDFLLD